MPRYGARRGRSRSHSRGRRGGLSNIVETRLSLAQRGRQAHHSRFGYEPPMGRMRGFGGNVSQSTKISVIFRCNFEPGTTFAGGGAAYLFGQQIQISSFLVTSFTAGAAPVLTLCPDFWRVIDNWKSFNVTGMKLTAWVPPEYNNDANPFISAGRAWSFGEVMPTAGPAGVGSGSFAMTDQSNTVAYLPVSMPTYKGAGVIAVTEEAAVLDPTYRRERLANQSYVTGRNERQFFKRYLKIPYTCQKGRGMNAIPFVNFPQTVANAVPPIMTSFVVTNGVPDLTQNEAFISYVADLSSMSSTAPGGQLVPTLWKATLYLTTYGRWDKSWSLCPSFMLPVPEQLVSSGSTFGQTAPVTPVVPGDPS